jgi:hypothetical protein
MKGAAMRPLLLALVGLVSLAASRPDPCDVVTFDELPAPVQQALGSEAEEPGYDHICRARDEGRVVYRARLHGNGITVDVSERGELLGRHWSGRD